MADRTSLIDNVLASCNAFRCRFHSDVRRIHLVVRHAFEIEVKGGGGEGQDNGSYCDSNNFYYFFHDRWVFIDVSF